MESVSVAMLGTIGGISLIVGLVAQFLLKPWLKTKYEEESHEKYSAIFNSVVVGLGAVLGLVGALVLNTWPPEAAQIVTGLLVGFVGGIGATGGAEWLGNLQKARK